MYQRGDSTQASPQGPFAVSQFQYAQQTFPQTTLQSGQVQTAYAQPLMKPAPVESQWIEYGRVVGMQVQQLKRCNPAEARGCLGAIDEQVPAGKFLNMTICVMEKLHFIDGLRGKWIVFL